MALQQQNRVRHVAQVCSICSALSRLDWRMQPSWRKRPRPGRWRAWRTAWRTCPARPSPTRIMWASLLKASAECWSMRMLCSTPAPVAAGVHIIPGPCDPHLEPCVWLQLALQHAGVVTRCGPMLCARWATSWLRRVNQAAQLRLRQVAQTARTGSQRLAGVVRPARQLGSSPRSSSCRMRSGQAKTK